MSETEEKKIVSLAGAREGKGKDKEQEKKSSESRDSTRKEPVYCSFCDRPNHMVLKMIEGPGVNICSECTMICVQYFMLDDRVPSEELKTVLESLWQISHKNK